MYGRNTVESPINYFFFCVIIIINTLIIEANSTSHYTRQSQVFLNEKLDLSKLGVGEEC